MKGPVKKLRRLSHVVNRNKILSFCSTIKDECDKKHILTLASSSSFFLILTFVPFTLLLTRALGLFLGVIGDGETSQFDLLVSYSSRFIPANLTGVVKVLSGLLKNALFAQGKYTIINFVFLFISSLGFINSIWRALSIITNDKNMNSIKKVLKGGGLIGIAFTFFIVVFFLPMIFKGLSFILSLKYVAKVLNFLHIKDLMTAENFEFFGMDFISFGLIIVFFTFLFKYILHPRVNLKSSLVGSLVFSLSMILLKGTFFLYVQLVKDGLMQNYGASYSLVLMFVWIFISMTIFYFSVIFTLTYSEYFSPLSIKKNLKQEGN